LQNHVDEFPRDEACLRVISDLLDTIIVALEPMVSQGWKGDEFAPKYLLSTVGNVIEMIALETGARGSRGLDKVLESLKDYTEKALLVIDNILHLLLKTQVADELPFIFEATHLHSLGSRTTGENILTEYSNDYVNIKFPEYLLIEHKNQEVFQLVYSLGTNPYVWGMDQNLEITSRTVNIAFAHTNGTKIPVRSLTEEREITIGVDRRTPLLKLASMSHPDISIDTSHGTSHSYLILPEESKTATLQFESTFSGGLGVVYSFIPRIIRRTTRPIEYPVVIELYIAKNYSPDENNYDAMTVLDTRWPGLNDSRLHTNYSLMIRER
jgi:hypothetical protein